MNSRRIRTGLTLLRERDFPKLFGAHLVSWFGTSMAPIAMAFGVLELTGSARDTGLVVASQTGAQVIALMFGGVVADRFPRRRVMIVADVCAMAAQASMAMAFFTGSATVMLLMGLMAMNGVALAFHGPALMGFIPQVVARDKLQPANALLGTARSGATSLGAACAGLLVAVFGAGVAVLVNACTFLASALFVARITPPLHQQPAPSTVLSDLRYGFAEFMAHRWLWIIVLQFSLVVAGAHSVYGLIGPAVAKASLGGAVDWGFIAAAMGIGTLAGGVAALRLDVRRPMLVATNCVFLFSLPALLLASTQWVWLIALGAFVNGVAGQIFGVLWVTTLHRKIPANVLSRVSAYDNLGSIALAPVGLIGAGFALESFGQTTTLLLAAGLIIVPTALTLLDREVRTLRLDRSE
ncbi:MAG: MFS transporter [Gammaproteobacteria bacterium]|nr:MFS transporter [Gammaproteobacteria bacterium]